MTLLASIRTFNLGPGAIRALALIALCWGFDSSAASYVSCPASGLPGYLSASPSTPNAAQQVTITAGVDSFDATSIDVQIQGDAIIVTLNGRAILTLPPPPTCLTYVLQPLAAGHYTVGLYVVDATFPADGPKQVATIGIDVLPPPYVSCPASGGSPSEYLAIDPPAPDATQPITITAGKSEYDPQSITVQVEGSVIEVELIARSILTLPPPPTCLTSTISPLPAGTYTVNLRLFDPNYPGLGTVLLGSTSLEVNGAGPLSGLWWKSSESGWGIHFAQHRNVVFATWYTYDSHGNPVWYVASDCELSAAASERSCAGSLYKVTGPTFFGGAFNPAAESIATVGSMAVSFDNNDAGTMAYDVGGETRTVPITRMALRAGQTPPIDYTDLWWNPNEPGWGVAITQQSTVIFLAWYVYDNAGKPMWYVASDCEVIASWNGCSGTLYRTVGPPFGSTFDTTKVKVTPVGNVNAMFSNWNEGVLSYTVNGVSSSKIISRLPF